MLHFLSFQSHRSVTSLSKMALPVRNNLRSLYRFIQKFHSPKRFLCAAAAKVNKVREGLQMIYELMNVLSTFEELVFVKYFNNYVHNRLSCDCIIVWLSAVKFILQLRKLSCILLNRLIALFSRLTRTVKSRLGSQTVAMQLASFGFVLFFSLFVLTNSHWHVQLDFSITLDCISKTISRENLSLLPFYFLLYSIHSFLVSSRSRFIFAT